MPTIYDIAQKTGFSIATVSKVLNNYTDVNEKTRKKILDTVNELGYLPNANARSLTTKKSWTIGVVFVEALNIGMKHPLFSGVIESFRKRVEQSSYDLLFVSRNIGNEKKSYLEHFRYRGVDGVVIVSPLHFDSEVQNLLESDIPTVFIDMHSRDASVVFSDNRHGSELAVDYLHSLGHRKIAHIAGHEKTFAGEERLKGFLEACQKNHLDIPAEYIVNGGYFGFEGGENAMSALLSLEDKPTAVFAAGDSMALGAMKVANDMGLKVPEDISIIGFDDIEIAKYTSPALTTVKQNTDMLGNQAADLLLQQINEKSKLTVAMTIPVELVKRDSCGEAKK
ncbi:LacI family DNA-binding transcriptional regulator [Alkalihalobacillus sp. LMS39]|uniref:LacI family DNA-binding transcriptional regulator n=1 Tax=Alkalihalobacillus sp. LMS39 TaxID=2924032 RepID=UPI001FB3CB07|nr:LacI family DNA-binding transcriptional regulator [Alkalihalobacillus sp. LMS39]UOE93547.1 LacI family transcriptional regulator [Alkalihalobacillus sp. LMS39]